MPFAPQIYKLSITNGKISPKLSIAIGKIPPKVSILIGNFPKNDILNRIKMPQKWKKERNKYMNEFEMARVFAMVGHQIEMLDEDSRERKYDANIDGVPAEMKRIITSNNIERSAAKAKYRQGAKIVLFQFDKDDERIRLDLLKLKRKGYNVLYFFTDEKKVRKL